MMLIIQIPNLNNIIQIHFKGYDLDYFKTLLSSCDIYYEMFRQM